MDKFNDILVTIDGIIWGVPLLILIMGAGIFLTIRLNVLQFRHLGKALKFMVKNEEEGVGEVSSFSALCTAMAATVGTGNIVGVAGAIVVGGPGALFWMVVAACFGMATKYSEGLLAVKYRSIDSQGHALGGPFYYIEKGMGSGWKWLAKLFAIFGIGAGLLGIGTITQVNSIAGAVKRTFDPNNETTLSLFGESYSIAIVVTAIIVAVLTALVVIGGAKRIAAVASFIVPFMAVLYVAICVLILIFNITEIPRAFVDIVTSAFGARAVAGGAFGAFILAMQKGVGRGVFSNEAGLGSAAIAAACAKTNEPVRQGLVTMTGTFIDTIIICNLTGFSIMVTDSWNIGLEGVDVTVNAFVSGIPWSESVGSFLLTLCLAFFAFTTILGWNFYSERCLEYISHNSKSAILTFRWLYILAVLVGPFMTLDAVWNLASVLNGLMAIPNLIALIALSGVIVAETHKYFDRYGSGRLS